MLQIISANGIYSIQDESGKIVCRCENWDFAKKVSAMPELNRACMGLLFLAVHPDLRSEDEKRTIIDKSIVALAKSNEPSSFANLRWMEAKHKADNDSLP